MKKKIFTLITMMIGFSNGFSQNISYKIGQEYESTLKHKDYGYFLGKNNSPVNVSFLRENDFSLQPIDLKTQNISAGITHDISSLGKDAVFEKLLNLDDNLFYIYSIVNKENKTRIVHARMIDDSNKSIAKRDIVLFESNEPKTVYLEPLKATRYYFTKSRNKEFELVTFIYPSREGKAKLNKDLVGFNLFDKNLNLKFSKEIEMPYFENLMSIMDYHVDSKGNIFMLLRVYDETHLANYKDIMENVRYELVKINGSELQKMDLGMKGKVMVNALLTDDLDGNLVIAGYYSNSVEKKNMFNGMYIYRLNLNLDTKTGPSNIKFYEFSLDLFKSYETEAVKEKLEDKGRLDAKLYLDDIFFHPNGDILIVNEQYKSESNSNSGANISTGNSKNYYLDIIALKVNKQGNLIWTKKIPKNQTGAGRSDLSYKYHYNNGNDYFIFIDNENNLNLTPDQAPKAHICRQGGYLVAVKMDAAGKMQKIPIFDLRNEDISVFPFDMFKVNDSTLIGRCSKDRKKRLIQITFK